MGCASSKQRKRCRHCNAPFSPVPKSYSMHVVHPPQQNGDSYHVVALTSTTLGSLALDSSSNCKDKKNIDFDAALDLLDDHSEFDKEKRKKEFLDGLIEAKTWSSLIQDKIPRIVPKTPIRTPPGEPETINTWELMAGLEEDDSAILPHRFRSFSFDMSCEPSPLQDSPRMNQFAKEDGIAVFRRSLQALDPNHPFYIKLSERDENSEQDQDIVVKDYCKGGKERLVVYFTSLRGVRKTYEDCCHVRAILKGLGVQVDERDVSMHSGFKDELKELLGEGFNGGGLPRVFAGKKYVGGAEEIRHMHEQGELEKLVEGCEMVEDDGGVSGGACDACGDIRFVPCDTCNGSCKIYYERNHGGDDDSSGNDDGTEEEDNDKEEEKSEEEESEYGFQRCPHCNENGLIRCPICCY